MEFYPQIVKAGNLYVGQTPLYVIKKGNKKEFIFTEKEMDLKRSSIPTSAIVSRIKGLGELNADILADAILNTKTRNLINITMENYDVAIQTIQNYLGLDGGVRKEIVEGVNS